MTSAAEEKGSVGEKRHRRSRGELMEAFHGARGETVDLFVYGTLLSDNHVRLILNRTVASEPVTLYHYMKVVPPGAFYFIVRQRGSQVRGRLLKALTAEELERLDSFEDEGNLYYRSKGVGDDLSFQPLRTHSPFLDAFIFTFAGYSCHMQVTIIRTLPYLG